MTLKRKFQKRDAVNLVGIALFLCLVGFLGWLYVKEFGGLWDGGLKEKAERFREVILSHGNKGILILTLVHVLQDVVSFIPAAVSQFAGGMIYGLAIGMLTGITGVAISTAINFYATRLLGRRIVTLFVSEKTLDKVESVMAGGVSSLVLFILFVIPFPKTLIVYAVGLTRYKAWKFFLISAIGRLPGMFMSTYAGAAVFEGSTPLIIALSACAVSGILLLCFHGRILRFLRKQGEKDSRSHREP